MMIDVDSDTTASASAAAAQDSDGDGRQPAPGDLRLVQLLVNSAEPDVGREEFADARALGAWLVAHGLLDEAHAAELTDADRARMVRLREALRDLLGANAGEPLEADAVAVLDAESTRVPLHVRIGDDASVALAPACGGIDSVVARLLLAIVHADAEGTWRRLKACRDDTCRWAFYDASRNASSAWCSMAVCGNRAKARRHRERKRKDNPPA